MLKTLYFVLIRTKLALQLMHLLCELFQLLSKVGVINMVHSSWLCQVGLGSVILRVYKLLV